MHPRVLDGCTASRRSSDMQRGISGCITQKPFNVARRRISLLLAQTTRDTTTRPNSKGRNACIKHPPICGCTALLQYRPPIVHLHPISCRKIKENSERVLGPRAPSSSRIEASILTPVVLVYFLPIHGQKRRTRVCIPVEGSLF